MRENKFRAWEKKLKEIIPVYDINFKAKQINTKGPWRTFDEIELMQYTGLKDKNGKEIYEGDILRYLDSRDCSTESGYDFEEFLNVGQVIFNDDKGRFDITNKSDISYDDWIESVSDCEIIGNIYENPELLEEIQNESK